MKNFTKTLVAATFALGATAANAAITIADDLSSEAWLSVYDSTSKQTFTLDLGVAGLTLGVLKTDAANASLDLTQFTDWNTFTSTANLATTTYAVAVGGKDGFSPNFMISGADSSAFNGLGFTTVDTMRGRIGTHALNINADANNQSGGVSAANDTTLVVDGDSFLGHHNSDGGGSTNLWGAGAYNPNTAYGQAANLNLVDMTGAGFTAVQSVMNNQFTLAGNIITVDEVSAVPVPAAVWLFGTALFGLFGNSRRRKAV